MAWECSASSHRCLVQNLVANHLLTSDIVIRAFERVDRSWFVPSSNIHEAFEDRPLPIGHNVTISAPHMHAIMAEIMAPFVVGEKRRVLDIGSGSGFLTCVLAAMVNESSSVVGVEHVPQLLDSSKASVAAHFSEWMTQHDDSSPPRIVFVEGDGLQLSSKNLPYPQFDAIHVGAAPSQVPQCLVDLLAPNGVLVVPVGPRSCTQQLLIVSKDAAGGVTTKVHSHVVFVPLTSLQHQLHPS